MFRPREETGPVFKNLASQSSCLLIWQSSSPVTLLEEKKKLKD
jgi:hypothetical protein